jgi:hypothetical protein
MAIATEDELLRQLNTLQARQDSLQKELDLVSESVIAVETDLRGLRLDALQQFLHSELDEKLISFTIMEELDHDVLLSLSASPGGEAEFARLQSSLNWDDMSLVPAILLMTYLGKGVPFTGV